MLHDDIVYRKPYFFPDKRLGEFISVLDLARVASCVFVPSSTVKDYIVKHFEPNTQIVVVPFSGSHVLSYDTNVISARIDEHVNFLHFLGNDPRKNSVKTLIAFLALAKKGYIFNLHIVGPRPKKNSTISSVLADLSEIGIDQKYYTDLSEESLALLYQRTDCLVYCSLDEGFGLPIAEASEIGCAVITSNFGSMLEIGQRYRSVTFVNPYLTHEIEDALSIFMESKYRRNLERVQASTTWEAAFEVILTTMGLKKLDEV